uniref:Uncharacterized protein n=2 Tax=Esox lucius TaxID=8010 RepID=A0A6Q2ZGS2_ESOLU
MEQQKSFSSMPMMWSLWMLLGFALSVDGYFVPDQHESLSHGRQLKINLPNTAETLEFIPANEPLQTYHYWKRGSVFDKTNKGHVSGKGSDRRWILEKVTFDDMGTYVQKNYWQNVVSSLKVSVTIVRVYEKCVAGEDLSISLAGIAKEDAHLFFSGAEANVTLVQHGAVVAQDLPAYWNRVKTFSDKIRIQNVNTSDVGTYRLTDRKNRVISIVKMELTDKHEYEGNPLMALLLLLGIPAGICCCCRKKIFQKKAQHTTTVIQGGTTEILHPPPPGGPSPGYNVPGGGVYPGPGEPGGYPQVHPPPNPGVPGQPQWTGPPPQPGFSPMYPPAQPQQWNGPPPNPTQDPMYPPAQPQQWNGPPPNPTQDPMYPPAQPQQWNGPQPSQPQHNPNAPTMGYTPVTYNALSSGEEMKMENRTPADPLLPTQPPQVSMPPAPVPPPYYDGLQSSGEAYQFNVDTGKNTTNNYL